MNIMPYISDVRYTRSELLIMRNRLHVATKAHRLLKMKHDGLVHELFLFAPSVKKEYDLLSIRYHRARTLIIAGFMVEGSEALTLSSYSIESKTHIDLQTRNYFGVITPVINGIEVKSDLLERGYGLYNTSVITDDIVDTYEELIEAIITYSAHKSTLNRFIVEIERIGRRVKALENIVIPQISDAIVVMSRIRDELEREEHARLSHIKKVRKSNDIL